MDKFELGDIVLLNFPFTNADKVKKRPALVIKDFNDGDLLVCRITSKQYNSKFDIPIYNYQECGLILASYIRVHKIAALEANMVEKLIGKTDKHHISKVKNVFSNLIEV